MQQQIALYRTTKSFKQNHKTTELKCVNCKEPFLANRKTAKFCSSSCRSQFWMTKNNKKVITIAVPLDIDDAFLDKIKGMLENYKAPVDPTKKKRPTTTTQEEVFQTEKDLREFLYGGGYMDFKVPKHDMGIYYDEGLTIKKLETGWLVKITISKHYS